MWRNQNSYTSLTKVYNAVTSMENSLAISPKAKSKTRMDQVIPFLGICWWTTETLVYKKDFHTNVYKSIKIHNRENEYTI